LQQSHTDPNNADTDGDGLSDGREVNETHTDPREPPRDLQRPNYMSPATAAGVS
jgi:hypothetical protein